MSSTLIPGPMCSKHSTVTEYMRLGTLWMCNKYPLTQPINWSSRQSKQNLVLRASATASYSSLFLYTDFTAWTQWKTPITTMQTSPLKGPRILDPGFFCLEKALSCLSRYFSSFRLSSTRFPNPFLFNDG